MLWNTQLIVYFLSQALTIYSLKHAEFKRASADYVAAVEQFNMHRRYHYTSTLKHWGEAGQTLEAFRIAKTREMITVLVERLRVMIHRLTSICTDLETASVRMDAEKVSINMRVPFSGFPCKGSAFK